MEIHEARVGAVAILAPDESVSSGGDCQALERKLGALIEGQSRQVVIDCTGVGQISSGAVRVLLLGTRKVARLGGRIVLCGLNERVRLALKVSGFDTDFVIVEGREEAVARAGEGSAAAAEIAPPPDPVRDRLLADVSRALAAGIGALSWPPTSSEAALPSPTAKALREAALGLLRPAVAPRARAGGLAMPKAKTPE